MKTEPVLFLTFNRPRETALAFEPIRRARPTRLYVASDAARCDRPGEEVLVAQVRRFIDENVDWECTVKKLWRTQNRGCKFGVSEAITWFFEHEEMGIIIEDDCVLCDSAFDFFSTLLRQFRDESSVAGICADYRPGSRENAAGNYGKIRFPLIWGWATWRRVWEKYDVELAGWDGAIEELKGLCGLPKRSQSYWANAFQKVKLGVIDTWDYQLSFLVLSRGMHFLHPFRNLVSNVGFGMNASHTRNIYDKTANLPVYPIAPPYCLDEDLSYDQYLAVEFFRSRSWPVRFMREVGRGLTARWAKMAAIKTV